MGDGLERGNPWGAYLKRLTSRPGWSVARLARESGIHRATIFGWIKDGHGDSLTIGSIRLIAGALGEPLEEALHAAAGLPPGGDRDIEMELIVAAPVDDRMKARMINYLLDLRDQDRERRLSTIKWTLEERRRDAEAG